MNDKDKEAYEKYLVENNVNQRQIWNELSLDEIWQAACDYKQKEIDELEKEKDYLCQKMENMRSIYKDSEKLQAENNSLIEALKNCPIFGEIHRDSNDRFKEWNLEYKYVFKNLEKK